MVVSAIWHIKHFVNCSNLTDVYITSKEQPVAERYGFPFNNNSQSSCNEGLCRHLLWSKTSEGLNPCNTTKFDSELSITLDKEWTTFTSAYNLYFSKVEGLTADTAKYDEANDAVALTQVKKVPAHTGLILKCEAANSYTLPILASDAAGLDEVTGTSLKIVLMLFGLQAPT